MRIFVSYSSTDASEALLLAEALQARGYTVFFDKETLGAGQSYDGKIERAVRSAERLSHGNILRYPGALTLLGIAAALFGAGHPVSLLVALPGPCALSETDSECSRRVPDPENPAA
jgi:hypothetical protein